MKIQTKLTFLVIILSSIIIAALLLVRDSERNRAALIFQSEEQEKSTFFDKIVALRGTTLEILAYDYTFWDEMVSFVSTGNKVWAAQNIDVSLSTYRANACWVYDTRYRLVYFASDTKGSNLTDMLIQKAAIENLFAESHFCHFFYNTSGPLLEVRGATIHPSADEERKTPVRGYFFTGRLWDKEYLKDLSKITDSRVQVVASRAFQDTAQTLGKRDGTVTFSRLLSGWEGHPVARMDVQIRSAITQELTRLSRQEFQLLAIFMVSALLLLSIFLFRWVSSPVRYLANSLKNDSPAILDRLRRERSEFGKLAVLIAEFFKQKQQLANEVEERTRAEERVKTLNKALQLHSAQLEAANKELEAFSYSVSHDLRAPLRHIDGFSELLQKSAAGALDDKNRRYVDNIHQSARKMDRLIDDILSFSRMGRNEMLRKRIDMTRLVNEVIQDLKEDAIGRCINWQIGVLPEIEGDPSMLRQVWVNLLSNALKYTRPRERADIEIGCISQSSEEPIFYVRDNGVGFDMQHVDKLFGVFRRLHRDEEFEGTGIGLANVKRIISRHGGRTWAEGQLEMGATFYFSLPQMERITA